MLRNSITYENTLPLDQQIEALRKAIKTQRATVARLAPAGHEVTDANSHLASLDKQLAAMILLKTN
jgi:hypothetical protein